MASGGLTVEKRTTLADVLDAHTREADLYEPLEDGPQVRGTRWDSILEGF